MSFSYYDNNNQVKKINFQVGSNWSDIRTDNDALDSIFADIDDGDGVISNTEYSLVNQLLNGCVSNFAEKNDNFLDYIALNLLKNSLDRGAIDVEKRTYNIIKNYNKEDFSLENLMKRFPENSFEIVTRGNQYLGNYHIIISDKANREEVLFASFTNGNLKIIIDHTNKDMIANEYDNNGELISYIDHSGKIKYPQTEKIVKSLKKQIYKKNNIGLPVTADNLSKTINKINSENVLPVLDEYSNFFNGETNLLTDIIGEFGIDFSERKAYLMHIKKALVKLSKENNIYVDDISAQFDNELTALAKADGFVNSNLLNSLLNKLVSRVYSVTNYENIAQNGIVDENFSQGFTGDCWLLASIIALNNTPKGREILNNTLTTNDDGSVTVKLQGVKKTYTITKEDLEHNTQLVTGDLDIRAIELAVNKYFHENGGVNCCFDIDDGNFMFIAYEILTGKSINKKEILTTYNLSYALNLKDINVIIPKNSITEKVANFLHSIGFKTMQRVPKEIKIDDEMIDTFNDESKVTTVVSSRDSVYTYTGQNNKDTIELISHHAYAVLGSDENNVFLVNPHDSSTTITISREDFKSFFDTCEQITL